MEIFNRVEKKYIVDKEIINKFITSISNYIKEDKYYNYTICNIYYDTDADLLIRNSLAKPVYKEKLRLRSYGVPDSESKVYLEIKKKYKSDVNKRRITLSLSDAYNYLNRKIYPNENKQVIKEIDYMINHYILKPRLFLAYDRIAYIAKDDSNLRITFDNNIRSRTYDLDLINGDYGNKLFEDNKYIMEIKCCNSIPLWLCQELSRLNIYPSSFSKYGKIYEKELIERRNNNV